MGEFLAQASRSGKGYYYIRCTIERLDPARKSAFLNRDPKRVLVAIVRDLDIVPDDPDPVDLAVALLPRFGKHVSWNVLSSRLASE